MNSFENPKPTASDADLITRRNFMKKSALSAGAITLLGQGIAYADGSSAPSKPLLRTYQRSLYISGTDANGKYTFTDNPDDAQVFPDDEPPDKTKVPAPTGSPPAVPSWQGAELTPLPGGQLDIQTNKNASADSPTSDVSINPSVGGTNITGYKKSVQVLVVYKWTYP